uniref:Uncharacterized protein n=1 Tax=Thermogemmatispora argillosa TaxID=2045280 RepID=A0A455T5T0_9CHLR|nr:hypothetical protein KTA_35250 [Thermogemmatispora argillosa]
MSSVMEDVAEEAEAQEKENHCPGINPSQEMGEPRRGKTLSGLALAMSGAPMRPWAMPGRKMSNVTGVTSACVYRHTGGRRTQMGMGQMQMLSETMQAIGYMGASATNVVGQTMSQAPEQRRNDQEKGPEQKTTDEDKRKRISGNEHNPAPLLLLLMLRTRNGSHKRAVARSTFRSTVYRRFTYAGLQRHDPFPVALPPNGERQA